MLGENSVKKRETIMKIIKGWITLASCLALSAVLVLIAINVFADPPQPGLSISSLGSNQFLVTITNSLSTTNYTLFWTPVLADPNNPWEAIAAGTVGQSNFTVDGSGYPAGFFQVALLPGTGVPPWEAANPSDPNSPILSVNITIPAAGSVVQ
jgi:hypothetical protein